MKIHHGGSTLKQKAKRHLLKRPHGPRDATWAKKHLRGPRYMYRFVDPSWGVVYGFGKDADDQGATLIFEPRKWLGGYGWDTERRRYHIYSNRYPKTKKMYRWQYLWKYWHE